MRFVSARRLLGPRLVFFVATLAAVLTLAQEQETSASPAQQTQKNQEAKPPQEAWRIGETQVTGEREREHDYRVKEATTATETDTPLRDTPQSVQVIDRQVIEDRKIHRHCQSCPSLGSSFGYASDAQEMSREEFLSLTRLTDQAAREMLCPESVLAHQKDTEH